jgi:hypothetical protein
MRLAALVIAIATVMTAPALTGQQSPPLLDEEAYAVYGSALPLFARDVPIVALLAHTRADTRCDSYIPPGWEEVVAAFRQANSE